MRHDSIFQTECLNLLSYLPFELSRDATAIHIRYLSSQETFFWKTQPLDLTRLPLARLEGLSVAAESLTWTIDSISSGDSLRAGLEVMRTLRELVLSENLQAHFWSRPFHITASGFKEGSLERTSKLLKELYDDKLMVPEKKGFLVDLWRSTGPYLVADEEGSPSFLDAASQIASLAIDHNHKSRGAMLLRPELQDAKLNLADWDVADALKGVIRRHSKLPFVHFSNSGAEAMETALRSCQTEYPERRHIIAFDGSFHGRTLVALHTTHSPAKRIPFEIHKDLVSFMPFPEDKEPHLTRAEPEAWTQTWASAQDPDLETRVSFWKNSGDSLIRSEIESLLAVRKQILQDKPLCVVIEPVQCEGGDRYASPRYFRALRLLTRALDVALVIDEVQCGFGLGGPFFWHKRFHLVDATGAHDGPDAIFQAKKSQIGICATRFKMMITDETSPASVHRGYIQAIEILDHSAKPLERKVTEHLKAFQKALGSDLVASPRNQGYAFAFDLPDAKIMNALVSKRFPNALLFYPAGERTARFRLWVGTHDHELLEIFSNLYRCFEELAKEGLIRSIPPRTEWLAQYPEAFREKIEKPHMNEHSIWPDFVVNADPKSLASFSTEKWDRAYHKLVTNCPQLILLAAESNYDLSCPPKSFDDLLKTYETNPKFTRLELVWKAARFFGTRILQATPDVIRAHAADITALQEKSYEAARQATAEQFVEIAVDPRGIVHIAFAPDGHLIGLSAAAPAQDFLDVPMLDRDPHCRDPKCLYSFDLTLDARHQGKGLGLRFKCEQYIAAIRSGARYLKSRNRYPEAIAMARLNFRLSAAITDINEKDYGGTGTALYQSWNFERSTVATRYRIGDIQEGSLKNKLTLSNFVSRHYVHDVRVLADALPASHRHLYLASGRAETADKSLRLLRWFRPTGLAAISAEGAYFGQTTAASRSLGGPWPLRFFDWPLVESPRELEQLFQTRHADHFLGFYADGPKPGEKLSAEIKRLQEFSEICKAHKIPFVLNETESAFWKSGKDFCVGGNEVDCDAIIIYPGHQLGVLAVKESLFLDKPLMLISTWDGDEFSLARMKTRILEEMP
ncbi:MAG: aminotransferase class III-fold pyridoxal phosphate-dependent enzyme [Bdellovibrionota bacterium]